MNIDVQNGVAAAMYYGYREDGTSVWLLASGELIRSEKPGVYWKLEADLYETANGQPVNGEFADPDVTVFGSMHLEVLQRHLIRFSIDGGPEQGMVPMMFGSHSFEPFPEKTEVRLPNFEEGRDMSFDDNSDKTPWLIVQMNPQGGSRWDYAYTSTYPHHGSLSYSSAQNLYKYSFSIYDTFPHSVYSATVACGSIDDLAAFYDTIMAGLSGEEPICVAWSFSGSPPDWGDTPDGVRRYFMPIGNFGDRRFTAVSEDGWIMEGFRLGYD
jgi:hypothetical protein